MCQYRGLIVRVCGLFSMIMGSLIMDTTRGTGTLFESDVAHHVNQLLCLLHC